MSKPIGNSKEDYLKTILIIKNEYGACRIADVSKKMNVSKSSASIALKKLVDDGYIMRDDWRVVLTDEGKQIAEEIYERDQFFYQVFLMLGISEETAKRDACMVEHVLSDETYSRIKKFVSIQNRAKALDS